MVLPMRRLGSLIAIPFLTAVLAAQEPARPPTGGNIPTEARPGAAVKRPLTELPYTPGLDLASMDRSADPCVDFYQYACGGWIAKNPIPADQSGWSVYAKLADENQQFLWGLLDTAAHADPTRTPAEQKIGDYFASCMDERAIDAAGSTPLQPELDTIRRLATKRDLAQYLGAQQLAIEGDLTFGFGSNQDFADSTQVIAFVDAGGLGLPDRDYYLKTDRRSIDLRRKYVAHVRRMFELIGESQSRAGADARTVMAIETALARASLSLVDRRDPYKLFHKMTRGELDRLTPRFRWGDFLDAQGLGSVAVFNITEPAFFKALDRLLQNQPLAAWQTYLRWHVTSSRAPFLSKPFVDADFDFYARALEGVTEQQPRWKKCVQWVDDDLGEALGQVFVAKTFSSETRSKTIQMTTLIEAAMADEIRQLTWMSDPTKQRALEKLTAIVNKIGYPEHWRDYSALTIERGEFVGNVRRATVFESRRQLAKIGKPVDRTEWSMTPPTVNASYSPQLNDMTFPAGVLQPPLYDPKMDDAPNYGNTGTTIGHELTHGFDDEGRQFDAHGNLKDWWTKADADGFIERLQCVQDQYAQYIVIDDIHINSKLTSGEDVADIGGTLLAYLAWKAVKANQRLEPRDGFTPEQRFFVGFAQWACSADRPERARLLAATNPHSPGKYRINGVVVNIPEFAQAFQCKAGQPMVGAHICKVW
jgi:putative endopeptidase